MRDEDCRSAAHNAAAHVHACKLPMDRVIALSSQLSDEKSWAEGTSEVCREISVIGYQRPAPSFSETAVNTSSICAAAVGLST